MTSIPTQTCWGCQHFDFTMDVEFYSEVTPGNGVKIRCLKENFHLDLPVSLDEFGATMEQGFTCPDYVARRK